MKFDSFISIINTIKDGTPFEVVMSRKVTPSAKGKKAGVSIEKITSFKAVKGVNYADRESTKEAVASGKVLTHELPWGQWKEGYTDIIEHKGKNYARMYLEKDKSPIVHYILDGKKINKDLLLESGLVCPSTLASKGGVVDCMSVDIENIVFLGQ